MALVNGYEAIWLDGKTTLVHRLMWESFYGVDIPEDCEIHHLDGNRKNNDISNLVCIEKWRHHAMHIAERFGTELSDHKQTKEEKRLYNKRYAIANRGTVNSYHREWYRKNRKRISEIRKQRRLSACRASDTLVVREKEGAEGE